MTVSIIISTYNRANYIGITIDSFLRLNYPKDNYEIIIIDNNSIDNTREVINNYLDNEFKVKVIYIFEHRQGVHYAKNTGAKLAKNEILYFTDDDMIADPELLNEIIYLFRYDKRLAVATGRVLPKWETTPPEWILKHCNNRLLSLLDRDEQLLVSRAVISIFTCHYAIRRDVFFEVEGLNPEIFGRNYFGDGEAGLNFKVERLGYWFAYNAKSTIWHIIPPGRMTQKYLNNRVGRSSAAGHSYDLYRRTYPNQMLYWIGTFYRIFKGILQIFKFIFLATLKWDSFYLRYSLAMFIYFNNLLKFAFKVSFNSSFKKAVLKNDWLSNDSEFDHINFVNI